MRDTVVVWMGNTIAIIIAAFFFALYTLHEIALKLNLRVNVPLASHTFKVMARREELEKKYSQELSTSGVVR